jgi:uracil DNA glycosylase
MNKPVLTKPEGPLRYPVVTKPSEYIPCVEELTIRGKKIKVESVNVFGRIHPEWHRFFTEMGINFNTRLKKLYCVCYAGGLDPRPLPEEIFDVFSMPLSSIKVVIVAQDPYPQVDAEMSRPVACGYCFATKSRKTPASLERIRAAIVKEFGPIKLLNPDSPNLLEGWVSQGIFLMNNTPVYFGKGQLGYGDEVESKEMRDIKLAARDCWMGMSEQICKHIMEMRKDTRFILVGSEAHYLRQHVSKCECTSHPSTRSDCDFTAKCFVGASEFKCDGEVVRIRWELM